MQFVTAYFTKNFLKKKYKTTNQGLPKDRECLELNDKKDHCPGIL